MLNERKAIRVALILEHCREIGNLYGGDHGFNLFAHEIREDPDYYEQHCWELLDWVLEDYEKVRRGESLYPWKRG